MRILLTGASGFLGREIYALLKSQGHTVIGMSRSGPDLKGDITKEGLKIKDIDSLDCVIHSAALLSFSEAMRKELTEVNVRGTSNVVRYAKKNKVKKFVYVSTAYVCGNYHGWWYESDLCQGQDFKNPYEESKWLGEIICQEFFRDDGRELTIVRPSIIIGRRTDGQATAFEGFYAPIKALARVMSTMEGGLKFPKHEKVEDKFNVPRLPLPLTIKGDPDSTLNLVPVDWVAQETVNLIGHAGTYHLTHPNPNTNREIISMINQVLGLEGPKFDKDTLAVQPHDKLYNRMVRDFIPYMSYEPKFCSTISPFSSLTGDSKGFIMKAIQYWREVNPHELEGTV